MTYNVDEIKSALQDDAKRAAREGEKIEVEVGQSSTYPAWYASVHFICGNGSEELMSGTGRTPEEARQNVNFILTARLLTQQQESYGAFAEGVAAAVRDKYPDADTPGNDRPETGLYLWHRGSYHAQMQRIGDKKLALHLWSEKVHHTTIFQDYDDGTRDVVVQAICSHLDKSR